MVHQAQRLIDLAELALTNAPFIHLEIANGAIDASGTAYIHVMQILILNQTVQREHCVRGLTI